MTNTKRIRSFIGIKPSQDALNLINTFKQHYSETVWARHIRWTPEQNIHITVRFLGDMTPEQIDTIKTALHNVLVNLSPFIITLTAPQPFPSLKKARMLASLVQKNKQLQQLATVIDKVAVDAGVPAEERPFRGHLTIGRFRKPAKGLDALLANTQTVTMPVEKVILFQSELKPTGAEYSEIARFQLVTPES